MYNEPAYNFCPLLRSKGYTNGAECCSTMCALYVSTDNTEGCALAVIAQEIAEHSKAAEIISLEPDKT